MQNLEQRKALRFRFIGRSPLSCKVSVAGKVWPGVVTNASAHGLGLEVQGDPNGLAQHCLVSIDIDWQGRNLQVKGELTHVAEWSSAGSRRLGVRLTCSDDSFRYQLGNFCSDLAQQGRASALSLQADEAAGGHVVRVHGALSLKTVADTIAIISTRPVARVDLSASRRDGALGGRLGQVALTYGVKLQGCPSDVAENMRAAGVCASCQACGQGFSLN